MADTKEFTPTSSQPLTIGFLSVEDIHHNQLQMLEGVLNIAQAYHVNVLCVPGQHLRSPVGFDKQANILYDLIGTDNLDGLIIWGSLLGQYITLAEFEKFCQHYHPLPIVNVEIEVAGIPSILKDERQGMHDVIAHLIEGHGYRQIAFIRGPVGQAVAQARYQTYLDTLTECGLPFDPRLVSPACTTWTIKEAEAVVYPFLQTSSARPEAIVAPNDSLAVGTLQALAALGWRAPEDMAVVGFDDSTEAAIVTPPLTTVRAPFYEMGQQTMRMVLAQCHGEKTPARVIIPNQLIVRQSCGCTQIEPMTVAAEPIHLIAKPLASAVAKDRSLIISALTSSIQSEQANQLLDAFTADITGESPTLFLTRLEGMLRQTTAAGAIPRWQQAISTLRQHMLPYFLNKQADLLRLEELCQQARISIGQTGERRQAYHGWQNEQLASELRQIGHALITTFDIEKLMDILAENLPWLNIPSFYVSLYENPEPYTYPQPAPAWSRLILAYTAQGRVDLETEGRRFPSRQLAPADLWPVERRHDFIIEALYFQELQLGFAVFEVGPLTGRVYEALRVEISSALQGALLLKAQAATQAALEQAYAEVGKQVQAQTVELRRDAVERARLQQEVIEAQQRAIQELSTPVIPVLAGIIIMPLIGSINTMRARDITRTLLAGITQHRAKVVIIDITGVPFIDSGVAGHLNKTIQAARLKGAWVMVTGITEAVAETIVDLGIDWSQVETLSDLQTGLTVALHSLRTKLKTRAFL